MAHNAAAVTLFKLALKGDFLNPCWNGQGECKLVCLSECWTENYWSARSGGAVKSLLVGLGYYLLGEEANNAYYWSTGSMFPNQQELFAGRLFSPVLGSATVVLSFFIGMLLFNRFVGFIFSITLLFHSLWLWHSRTTMTEVFLGFFLMLSVFLLLYSLKNKDTVKMRYFVLSAITFAVTINVKLPAIELFPFFVVVIFFRNSWKEKLSFMFLKNKKYILKSLGLIAIFVVVLVPAIFLTEPFYYIDPINQVHFFKQSMYKYHLLHPPWQEQKPHIKIIGTFSATVLPIVDYYYKIFPENRPQTGSGDKTVISNWSTTALTVFFIVGVIFLIFNLKNKNLLRSEFLLLFWLISIYILAAFTLDTFNSSRYYIPLFMPIILTSSYGLSRFLNQEQNLVIKSLFVSIFMITHASTILIFSDRIYYDPSFIWYEPMPISYQESLEYPLVLVLGAVFLLCTAIFAIRKLLELKKNNTDDLKLSGII